MGMTPDECKAMTEFATACMDLTKTVGNLTVAVYELSVRLAALEARSQRSPEENFRRREETP